MTESRPGEQGKGEMSELLSSNVDPNLCLCVGVVADLITNVQTAAAQMSLCRGPGCCSASATAPPSASLPSPSTAPGTSQVNTCHIV